MKLTEFRVRNYRSIRDSEPLEITDRTVLVGRNESGKSNLLMALHTLNPPDGLEEVDFTKNYPRDMRPDEFDPGATFLETTWKLSETEQEKLKEIFPRARDISQVRVKRPYAAKRTVGFAGLELPSIPRDSISKHIRKAKPSIQGSLQSKTSDEASQIKEKWGQVIGALEDESLPSPKDWAKKANEKIQALNETLSEANHQLPDQAQKALQAIKAEIRDILDDDKAHEKARGWVVDQLPVFVYLDEYPRINGHQNLDQYFKRKNDENSTEADINFEKLCKVAGLDPKELHDMKDADSEKRNLMANRASAAVTSRLKELWTDNPLKVRFNLDGRFFDTFVSDSETTYDVDVNLNERSRGLRWYFSFWITFAADTRGGDKDEAILLLDEPGLFLHATSQKQLIKLLWDHFDNQVIYTTHSPFMVPVDKIETIRTVTRNEENGTTTNNQPVGDSRTLFPLQSALGYTLSQTLFVGNQNLVVEGVTDYWYIAGVRDHLQDIGEETLDEEIVVTPAGGAQRIPTLVALLASQEIDVIALLDDEPRSRGTQEQLVKKKLVDDRNTVFVSESWSNPPEDGADLEDLLDPEVYEFLVDEAYATELEDKTLELNENIPRIAKRFETAFSELGLDFHKTRPAKLFIKKLSDNPDKVLTPETLDRFRQLFKIINERVERHIERRNARSEPALKLFN